MIVVDPDEYEMFLDSVAHYAAEQWNILTRGNKLDTDMFCDLVDQLDDYFDRMVELEGDEDE